MLVEAFVTLALSAVILFLSIRVAGCAGEHCNVALGQASIYVTPIAGAIVVVLTIGLGIFWGSRGRALWIPPVLGIGLILISFVVALIINTAALTPAK